MDVMPGCNTEPVLGVENGASGRPVFFFHEGSDYTEGNQELFAP